MAQNEQGNVTNVNGIDPVVLDDIINRLLESRQARTVRQVQLSENEIRQLCAVSREIFLNQPNLLELEAPIKICGIYPVSLDVSFMSFIIFLILCCILICWFLNVDGFLIFVFIDFMLVMDEIVDMMISSLVDF